MDNLFNLKDYNGVPIEEIETIFNFWKDTFNKRNNAKLDDTRKKKIASALKAHGADTCKEAILGCSISPWNRGQNPGNKQYTDIELIFRNAGKVEQFAAAYKQETEGQQEMDEWLQT